MLEWPLRSHKQVSQRQKELDFFWSVDERGRRQRDADRAARKAEKARLLRRVEENAAAVREAAVPGPSMAPPTSSFPTPPSISKWGSPPSTQAQTTSPSATQQANPSKLSAEPCSRKRTSLWTGKGATLRSGRRRTTHQIATQQTAHTRATVSWPFYRRESQPLRLRPLVSLGVLSQASS